MTTNAYNEPIVNGTIADVLGNEYEVVNGKVGRRIDPARDRQEVMVDDQPHSAKAGVAGVRLVVESPESNAD